MKPVLVAFALALSLISIAQALPKECFGFYAGEMAAYTVVKNDVEMNIDQHDVEVHITDAFIFYTSGTMTLQGTYTCLKQSGNEYLIKAELTNGKSVSYQLDLLWNKKKRTLFMAGKNGEPDLSLERLQN